MKSMNMSKMLGLIFIFLIPLIIYGQYGKKYAGPNDPAGDESLFRSGDLNGNRMYFYYHNNTSICDTGHGKAVWNRWPNQPDGVTLMHGLAAVIAARVYIEGDTLPVTDPNIIEAKRDQLSVLYYAQQGFRNRTDLDPTGTFEWGIKPVYGYLDELGETPAQSNKPESWPPQGWPAPNNQTKWQGEWNGRFGRGVMKADLEVFFVSNDAHDQEYLGPEDEVRYYPRPGLKIGDIRPEVTIQKGLPWGGLGLRLETRGFQWRNPQARDAVFFEYTVANVSNYDLPEVCFGYYLHPYVGQDHHAPGDDQLFFDKKLDMSYNWDYDGIGLGGIPTCTFGMAYLESPAKPFDGQDNDDDGLTDEKRDNTASVKIGAYDGITDLPKFLDFYNLTEADLQEHWDADEDQDWRDGNDANGDGIYQAGEDPGDDVGLDGVGPGELNYNGPDEGECNHQPDFKEGVGCEPNFAFTDVSESDMLGLTAFHTFDHDAHPRIHQDDERYWNFFSDQSFDEFKPEKAAWVNLFATGPFTLYQGRTERISMALMASYDPLEILNSSTHAAPILYRKKEIAQIIYESDYQFATPPRMPTLTATALDGKVILTWDDAAEKYTREPLLKNINDFEGYKLFKATDYLFTDAEIITDGHGTPVYKKPIFQCDLKDGKWGFTDFGLVEGTAYNLGSDNGIRHYFIDENVENGKTYYYALVAYDYGIPDIATGVPPSENTIIIELDDAENIKSYGRNVAVVTPHQRAAGYLPPEIEIVEKNFAASLGSITPQILNPDSLKPENLYKVTFNVDTVQNWGKDTLGVRFTTNGYRIYNITHGHKLLKKVYQTTDDSTFAPLRINYIDSIQAFSLPTDEDIETDVFEGLCLKMRLNNFLAQNGELDYENTGWRVGNLSGNVLINIIPNLRYISYYPWEYEIIFGEPGIYSTRTRRVTTVRDENYERIDKSLLLTEEPLSFYVINRSFVDSSGNYLVMDLLAFDYDSSGTFDPLKDRVIVGTLDDKETWSNTLFLVDFDDNSELPQPNDAYRLAFKRPFFLYDNLIFKVLAAPGTSPQKIKAAMDSIQVVPNPYVATNRLEPAVDNYRLNQKRRIMFTHLPARCTIKIFTASGVLVDEIDVENPEENGTTFWDLTTKEDLEVSAGIYVYYVKAKETGDEKIGKFGIIK